MTPDETPTPTDALAQLRHLYVNLTNGGVRDTASAQRIAEGLLSPAIAALETWSLPVVAGERGPDVRCECCGYMTHHREHMSCIRAATSQPTHNPFPRIVRHTLRDDD